MMLGCRSGWEISLCYSLSAVSPKVGTFGTVLFETHVKLDGTHVKLG